MYISVCVRRGGGCRRRHPAEVAGDEPAVGVDRLGGVLGVVPVAAHHRPAAQHDRADVAGRRSGAAVVVDDPQLDAAVGRPDGVGDDRRRRRRGGCRWRGSPRCSRSARPPGSRAFADLGHQLGRHACGAGAGDAQARRVGGRRARVRRASCGTASARPGRRSPARARSARSGSRRGPRRRHDRPCVIAMDELVPHPRHVADVGERQRREAPVADRAERRRRRRPSPGGRRGRTTRPWAGRWCRRSTRSRRGRWRRPGRAGRAGRRRRVAHDWRSITCHGPAGIAGR